MNDFGFVWIQIIIIHFLVVLWSSWPWLTTKTEQVFVEPSPRQLAISSKLLEMVQHCWKCNNLKLLTCSPRKRTINTNNNRGHNWLTACFLTVLVKSGHWCLSCSVGPFIQLDSFKDLVGTYVYLWVSACFLACRVP